VKKKNNIIAIIPARLSSSRLPNKLLLKIDKFTILEHVINRVILSNVFSKIIVTSPDIKIKNLVKNFKNVFFYKSKKKYFSGTARSLEAAKNIKFSKLVIIFADEPLIRPNEIKLFVNKISRDKKSNIWNATIRIKKKYELEDINIVKCIFDKKKYIFNYKRSFKSKENLNEINKTIRKSVGLIAFKSNVIKKIVKLKKTNSEKIEQINFLKKKELIIKSVKLNKDFFSINNNYDYKNVRQIFKINKCQKLIIKKYYQSL
jgi:3-deoxy-manno-octulosonate cytidylyltransferase (CMP-KDO synthetase)